jgi:CMP-N,N'-diacetyllegionaminic acid synthase
MKVIGLIPARGGSKGLPRKNIRVLNGEPLLYYTASAALTSRLLSRVILSTEDEEIARIGKECGLDVPFLRPMELAQDDTPTLPVVQHALKFFENRGEYYDAVCLLQPTNPLRRAEQIDACIQLLEEQKVDTVFTVLQVPPKYNPHWVYFQSENGLLHISTGEQEPLPRRQMLPQAYHREGSVYVTRRDVIMKQNSLYGSKILGYELNPDESVNIDSLDDFTRAEKLLAG